MSAQVRRLCLAALAIAIGVAVSCVVPLLEASDSGDSGPSAFAGESALSADNAAVSAFIQAGGDACCNRNLPETVMRETFNPGVLGASKVLFRDGVVGLMGAWSADEAYERVRSLLVANGWVDVSGHGEGHAHVSGVTFAKADGAYRWAYVFCQDSGSSRMVVMVLA
ncbi:MAG: hypothetical protein K6F70_06875 [Eggerthellaceae bacterium]|nr:hypothetical protein [Eggerthellaceae bacterium]